MQKNQRHTSQKQDLPLPKTFEVIRTANRFMLYGSFGLFLLSLFLADMATFAVDITGKLGKVGENASIGTKDLGIIIASIIQTILGLLGVVFIILIIYSGFLWMTASGNDEKIKTAQGHLRNAVIGVAIVIGAQIVTYFVVYNITAAAIRGQ
ncbi:hypothetical protein HYW94_00480 [Candidatus Uhrbacteria bacterium]|nr:hypothetical protein [Candidatus Uhrbacteria bacterium]